MQKKFKAVIQEGMAGGAFVIVPFDVERVFGQKRVKIKAMIDGEAYRGSLVRMGGPDHILVILKEIRKKIGKDVGDTVTVRVEVDTEPREIAVPHDFAQSLDQAGSARAFFDTLSFTHRREWIMWIESARKPETRTRRIASATDMLRQHRKTR